MTLALIKDNVVLNRVDILGQFQEGAWVDLPDGSRVSPAYDGWALRGYELHTIQSADPVPTGYRVASSSVQIVNGLPKWVDVVEIAPPQPYQIAKTTPWLRMTEDEAAIMDAVMSETTARLKQIYMAAQFLSSGDSLWSTMHDLIAGALPGGSTRADELLAPEG
ncbi:hypothetical protein HRR99_03360 [Agrobacterium vaccinii]|uniref:hypothetical protein n=1 Tax=Agrobacterium vaccinii TaxID=2735528 RepID=UPI001E5777CA|nr:hypothetical protein [Agrobacterium vaccinii]UHS60624.1 hypothetical protein HRR99_03360 [Agrobacterium vaccinii]